MNRVGDGEYLLQDIVYSQFEDDEPSLFSKSFQIGFGVMLGLWVALLATAGTTILAMVLIVGFGGGFGFGE